MSLEGDMGVSTTYYNSSNNTTTGYIYIKDERFDNTLRIRKDGEL
jgi:hypothetical protein